MWQQREGFQGIVVDGRGGRHEPRPVSGATFDLDFSIHDFRSAPKKRWHRVEVRLGRGVVLLNKTYRGPEGISTLPGSGIRAFHETLACPAERAEGVLTISMVNEHGQYFEDAISVSFNKGFEQALKWIALMPFAVAVVAIVVTSMIGPQKRPLPF